MNEMGYKTYICKIAYRSMQKMDIHIGCSKGAIFKKCIFVALLYNIDCSKGTIIDCSKGTIYIKKCFLVALLYKIQKAMVKPCNIPLTFFEWQ
jgi:hypothetical protein